MREEIVDKLLAEFEEAHTPKLCPVCGHLEALNVLSNATELAFCSEHCFYSWFKDSHTKD